MSEDDVAAIVSEWTAGNADRIREDPDSWVRRIFAAVTSSDDPALVETLAYPLKALFEECGESWLAPTVDRSRVDRRSIAVAADSVYAYLNYNTDEAKPGHRMCELFGRDLVIDTWIRHNGEDSAWDFWPFEVFSDMETEAVMGAWALLIEMIDRAPPDQASLLGAGFLEDVIAEIPIEVVEDQAGRSEKFRLALRNVWIDGEVPREFFERVERAAGAPLKRQRW